jgi:hypothetical protein
MDGNIKILTDNISDFMNHLKSRYSLFHLSNLFFRDIHYGIKSYLETRRVKVAYGEAERLAVLLIRELEKSSVLKPIKNGSWMLNYPEFRKPPVKPAAPAKPAAAGPNPTPAANKPAGAAPGMPATTASH